MNDYVNENCVHCAAQTVIYHQYIGDGCCETCGAWQVDEYEQRVRELEAGGLTRSDAQGVADAEAMKEDKG